MTDAFGASRVKVRPPERGIFPLDHDGECKDFMQGYLSCLKTTKDDYFPCKQLSKAYLQCRMDRFFDNLCTRYCLCMTHCWYGVYMYRNLMKQEDLNQLGLGDDNSYTRVDPNAGKKEAEGFVAGFGVKASNKWKIW
jgi:hypothetical protein